MISINKEWFAAGQKFGWEQEFRRTGIGLDERMFANMSNEPVELLIQRENKVYNLYLREAYEISKRFNATYNAKGLKLIVFPKDILVFKKYYERN